MQPENKQKDNSDNLDTIFAKDIDWAIGASDGSTTISAAETSLGQDSETHDDKVAPSFSFAL